MHGVDDGANFEQLDTVRVAGRELLPREPPSIMVGRPSTQLPLGDTRCGLRRVIQIPTPTEVKMKMKMKVKVKVQVEGRKRTKARARKGAGSEIASFE